MQPQMSCLENLPGRSPTNFLTRPNLRKVMHHHSRQRKLVSRQKHTPTLPFCSHADGQQGDEAPLQTMLDDLAQHVRESGPPALMQPGGARAPPGLAHEHLTHINQAGAPGKTPQLQRCTCCWFNAALALLGTCLPCCASTPGYTPLFQISMEISVMHERLAAGAGEGHEVPPEAVRVGV